MSETEAVSREELYDQVWAEPMSKVVVRYSVSTNYLSRICKRMNVPRPGRGYWAKHKVGDAPPAPPLPNARPGNELEWVPNRGFSGRELKDPKPPGNRTRRKTRRRVDHPETHPLVAEAKEHFKKGRLDHNGYFKPNKKLIADIFASPAGHARALEAADELYLTLEDAGYQVVITTRSSPYTQDTVDPHEGRLGPYVKNTWSPWRPTVVFLGTLAYGISVYELSECAEVQLYKGEWVRLTDIPHKRIRRGDWTSTHEFPSGRFAVRIYCPYRRVDWEKTWKETRPGQLNTKYKTIRRELEKAAPKVVKLVGKAERRAEQEKVEWEAQKRELDRKWEEERRQKAYDNSREHLLSIIENWTLACRVEEFFVSLEAQAESMPEEEHREFHERIQQAREMFGGVETLKRFELWKTPDQREA